MRGGLLREAGLLLGCDQQTDGDLAQTRLPKVSRRRIDESDAGVWTVPACSSKADGGLKPACASADNSHVGFSPVDAGRLTSRPLTARR